MKRIDGFLVALLLQAFLLEDQLTNAFRWDVDTAEGDHCTAAAVATCRTDETFHFVCARTCTDYLHQTGMLSMNDDPDGWYDLTVTKANRKIMELADTEGYVTLYVVLPLYPGMAQYWKQLLDHVQSIFPYTLEVLVLPVQKNDVKNPPHIQQSTKKLVILEETTQTTEALEFLLPLEPMAGYAEHTDLMLDRVTIFVVASDASYVERLIHPTMNELEQRINVYMMQLKRLQDRDL